MAVPADRYQTARLVRREPIRLTDATNTDPSSGVGFLSQERGAVARYRVANIAGIAHLGRARYDPAENRYTSPEKTICGIEAHAWSSTDVRIDRWGNRRIGSVCLACDRSALWETMRRALAK